MKDIAEALFMGIGGCALYAGGFLHAWVVGGMPRQTSIDIKVRGANSSITDVMEAMSDALRSKSG